MQSVFQRQAVFPVRQFPVIHTDFRVLRRDRKADLSLLRFFNRDAAGVHDRFPAALDCDLRAVIGTVSDDIKRIGTLRRRHQHARCDFADDGIAQFDPRADKRYILHRVMGQTEVAVSACHLHAVYFVALTPRSNHIALHDRRRARLFSFHQHQRAHVHQITLPGNGGHRGHRRSRCRKRDRQRVVALVFVSPDVAVK